jgi:hypothetical protein
MADEPTRKGLSDLLSRMLAGTCSYYSFYNFPFTRTTDRAVKQIYTVLFEMFCDDLAGLKHPVSVTQDQRNLVNRCVSFLDSGRPYEWPDFPESGSWRLFLLLVVLSIALALLPLFGSRYIGHLTIPVSLIVVISMVALHLCHKRSSDRRTAAWMQVSDFGSWPFFTASDDRDPGES